MVRFRDGQPERWSGWEDEYPGFVMTGVCRSLHRHGDLAGKIWVSAGTSKRFYMLTGDAQNDVTPWDHAVTLTTTDPFASTTGSKTVTVTHPGHGHEAGDIVKFSGATAGTSGIPVGEINTQQIVATWVDGDHYTFDVATTPATATTNFGGAAVQATYLFTAGTTDFITGGGWGSLAWSEDVWGGSATAGLGDQIGMWSQDNWGEDLAACALNGPIFYWDATNPTDRMVNILDLTVGGTADGNAPAQSQFIIISHRDRHLLAFGCTVFADVIVEPLTFRWCDQENIYNWNEASLIGTAGSLPLSNGSRFIAGLATAREILAWTDQALYSIQYVGPPYIYTAELLDRWSDIAGMKACTSFNGVVYWMGRGGFYAYSGRTDKMQCPVWDYIGSRINREQFGKTVAGSNQNYNEVIWYYVSNASGNTEIDSYVAVNVTDGSWTFGSLTRTAWLDLDAMNPVIAATPPPDSRIYEHDNGAGDDGSTNPPTPINAFIESGPIELSSEGSYDKGDKFMFIRHILPDITWRQRTTSSTAPTMNITLKMRDKPGGGFIEETASPVQRSVVIPVEQFTEECHVRLRGRSLTIRLESNTLGSEWRSGVNRIDARTDGQR